MSSVATARGLKRRFVIVTRLLSACAFREHPVQRLFERAKNNYAFFAFKTSQGLKHPANSEKCFIWRDEGATGMRRKNPPLRQAAYLIGGKAPLA